MAKIRRGGKEGKKTFWKMINPQKKTARIIKVLKGQDGYVVTSKEKGKIIEQHFQQKFQATPVRQSIQWDIDLDNIKEPQNKLTLEDQIFLMKEITKEEVVEVLSELKVEKAPGTDQVTPEMLKNLPSNMIEWICKLFNNIYNSSVYPEAWKEGNIVLLLKRAPSCDIGNYRPICLISCLSKLMSKIVAKRLQKVVETSNILSDTQNGFRKNRRCSDSIFILNTVLEKCAHENKKVYMLFVDLSGAYDNVSRIILVRRLKQLQFPAAFINYLKSYYTDDYITTESGGARTRPRYQGRGLR